MTPLWKFLIKLFIFWKLCTLYKTKNEICNKQNETTIRRVELLFSCWHSSAIPLIRLFPKNPAVGRIFGLSIDGQLCPSLSHTTFWTFMFCSCFIKGHGQSRRVWRNLAISVIGFSGKMVLFAWRPWHLFVIGETWPKKKQFFDETSSVGEIDCRSKAYLHLFCINKQENFDE